MAPSKLPSAVLRFFRRRCGIPYGRLIPQDLCVLPLAEAPKARRRCRQTVYSFETIVADGQRSRFVTLLIHRGFLLSYLF